MPDFSPIGDVVVAEFIDSESGEAVTRRRFGVSTVVDFRTAQGPAVDTLGIRVFIAPITARMDRRPEGTRRAGDITMYSQVDFRAANDAAATRGDEVVRADGSVYAVEAVDHYAAGKFYVTTLSLKKGPT